MDALNTRVSAVLAAIIDRDNLDKKNDEDSIKLIGKRSRMLESLLNLSRNTTIEHLLCMLRYDPSINIMYIIYGRPPMFNVNDNIVHSLDTNSEIIAAEDQYPYNKDQILIKFEKLLHFIKTEL